MEDRSALVGTRLPSYSFTVERGKIKEFAAAIGDLKEGYLNPVKAARAGYADVIAPPTYATVISHWGGMGFHELCDHLKLNRVMILHGGQEFEYLGDIAAGDVITVETLLSGYAEKKNMHVLTMDSVYLNQRGEEVLRSRSLMLEMK